MLRAIYCFLILMLFCSHSAAIAQERNYLFESSDVTITKATINSKYSEYAPAFCGDGIIFTSNKPHAFGVITIMESDSSSPDNLYFLPNKSTQADFLEKLNTPLQEGTSSYDSTKRILYFTGNVKVKNQFVLGIFSSTRAENGSWGKASPVLIPTDVFSYFHPCILNSGQTLIVASDRKDGFGGIDLYRSALEQGTWSEPVNMGESINGPYNEGYPSFCAPDYLIFSSTGHESMGGYDIFCCRLTPNHIGPPFPAGNGINTASDDFGLIFDPVRRMGYFSSNRDQNTGDDIYEFRLHWPDFYNCIAYVEPRYCYSFSEENSLESEDAELFYYQWDFGDGTTSTSLEADHCFAGAGTYAVELLIRDKKDTAFFLSQVSYEHEIVEKKGLRINCPDTIFVGDTIVLSSNNSSLSNYSIDKFYWDLGDHFLLNNSAVQYAADREGTFPIVLGVCAHDSLTVANDSLDTQHQHFCTQKNIVVLPASEKRQWMNNRNFSKSRKAFKSIEAPVFSLSLVEKPEYSVFLGSSKDSIPVLRTGTNAIIRIIKEDTIYRYLYGSADSLHAIYTSYIGLKGLGIDSAFVIVLSKDTIVGNQIKAKRDFEFTSKVATMLIDTIPARAIIPINVVPVQPLYVTDTVIVYFDFNKSTLNTATKNTIDSLVRSGSGKKYLTYQLLGFADSDGDPEYNLALSKTRNKAVVSHLTKKGVKSNNITSHSYGEEPPSNFVHILSTARNKRCVLIIRTFLK